MITVAGGHRHRACEIFG